MHRMLRLVGFVVGLGMAAPVMAQDPLVRLSAVGGGVLGARQQPADLYIWPTGQLTLYVVVYDPNTFEPIPNLTMTVIGYFSYSSDGGHTHGGLTSSAYGNFSPVSGTTGGSGGGFSTTYHAGPAAGKIVPYVQFTWEGNTYQLSPENGIRVSEEEEDYDWLTETTSIVLVGSTTAHPSNHYAKFGMNVYTFALAEAYRERWSRSLACNDSGLIWGGVFDLNSNYTPPHFEHNIGESQDIRANRQAHAIPHNAEIRTWFENKLRELFSSFLLEDEDGPNEHYHVRW